MKDFIGYQLIALMANIDASKVGLPQSKPDAVLTGVLNLVYMITGVVAVVALIISGFMYVASSGNAETVKKAKNGIIYSIIGLIVVASAFTITHFVMGRF